MALDVSKIKAEISSIKTVIDSTAALVHRLADQVRELRSAGGGAAQNEIDALASELHGAAEALGAAVAVGTAAEGEPPQVLNEGVEFETVYGSGDKVSPLQSASDKLSNSEV